MNNTISTLDKKEKTQVVFGATTMKMDDFEDLLEHDKNLKKKFQHVEEELKKY